MKKFTLSCLSLIMVAACTTTPANDLLESDGNESVNLQNGESSETLPPGKARVRFVFDGLTFNRIPMTKTDPLGLTRGESLGLTRGESLGLTRGGDPVGLTDAGVNYLYIYEGETLLLKQTAGEAGGGSGSGTGGGSGSGSGSGTGGGSGAAGGGAGGEFGSPSLVLDYGEHALTFVASDFELDDTDNQVRSGNTFSARKTVTVNENTTTQSVVMARIKTGLRLVINDSPDNLARLNKINVVLTRPYINIPPGSQLATTYHDGPIYINFDVPQTTPAALTLYTFCPSSTEVFNQEFFVMMRDKDTNSLLCNKRVTAPLLMNRITEVRGTWLTTGSLVTVNTEWGEELVIDL